MQVLVEARFRGPATGANGGYAAGAMADAIAEPVVVRLERAIPIDEPMQIHEQESGRWEVFAGSTRVASARRRPGIDLDVRSGVDFSRACHIAQGYTKFENYRSPSCFVCGVQRAAGDGLRVFPGELSGSDLLAAPFVPDRSVADERGTVRPAVVWAALDCPGYFAAFRDGTYALLGEFTVEIAKPLRAEARYVVTAWPLDVDRRKRTAGTAVFDGDGACMARAFATWIEVAPRT